MLDVWKPYGNRIRVRVACECRCKQAAERLLCGRLRHVVAEIRTTEEETQRRKERAEVSLIGPMRRGGSNQGSRVRDL